MDYKNYKKRICKNPLFVKLPQRAFKPVLPFFRVDFSRIKAVYFFLLLGRVSQRNDI